ncbi:MAG: hypothetical protein WBB39_04165, partial [Candidatus Saccharimonadales bacterium]
MTVQPHPVKSARRRGGLNYEHAMLSDDVPRAVDAGTSKSCQDARPATANVMNQQGARSVLNVWPSGGCSSGPGT